MFCFVQQTLVAETLVLAKTHGYVEKIEHELEEELQRENTEPPNRILAKWRRNGETMLKNKYTLLTVALFCVTECALILGELILDLHKVKVVLEAQETDSKMFVERLHKLYPDLVYPDAEISRIYEDILKSKILWKDNHNTNNISGLLQEGDDPDLRHILQDAADPSFHHKFQEIANPNLRNIFQEAIDPDLHRISKEHIDPDLPNLLRAAADPDVRNKRYAYAEQTMIVLSSGNDDSGNIHTNSTAGRSASTGNHDNHGPTHGHSLEENIAHAFHMASITILSILVFETILKALCAGTVFFQRKLETFDLCIVVISFVVDLVCMQIMPRYKIQDFVFILAFLLPWRVIRVVNSLVVAVQDHEHFRLKLIYGRKKKIVNSLRESEIKLQLFRAQCNALKRLCYNEGVDESKIDQILMVEECIVNKAGKSKCKIKIDNSSVILLNDKSDFPRLSPRPSLLSLVGDKVGRRKSMQPPGATMNDRELFLNTKDSSKRGILKSRARSNSESGRGTLSSPEDGPSQQNSFGECGVYSGLSTPIVINRKSSLNSPLMATHVRNILNSLEDKVNQMNGSCSRLGGPRGSIDTDSIAEDVEGEYDGKTFSTRVDSIEEATEGGTECYSNGVSYVSKRRASLQPQKCVDEDDCELSGDKKLAAPNSCITTKTVGDNSLTGNTKINSVSNSASFSPQLKSYKFIPTTIQIDPPSIHSNYSLSSSASSSSNSSNETSSVRQQCGFNSSTASFKNNQSPTQTRSATPLPCAVTPNQERSGTTGNFKNDQNPTQSSSGNHLACATPQHRVIINNNATSKDNQSPLQITKIASVTPFSCAMATDHGRVDNNITSRSDQSPTQAASETPVSYTSAPNSSHVEIASLKFVTIETVDPQTDIPEPKRPEKTVSNLANLKPKTLRTPSDVENQNNLTFSESSDICETQIRDDGTMNISIADDNIDRHDSISSTSHTCVLINITNNDMPVIGLMQDNIPDNQHVDNSEIISAREGDISSAADTSKMSLRSVDDIVYPPAGGSSVDPPECDIMRSAGSYVSSNLDQL